jgi:hypothetical protein
MRVSLAAFVGALALCTENMCFAQNSGGDSAIPSDPKQWTQSSEGNRHDASGTNCLDDVAGFAPLAFTGADMANLLGSCVYVDNSGTGNAGVRVRRYVPGEGESQESVANDRALMEPDPVQGAPLFTVRMAPVTTGDGKMGGRVTITKTRNGYLVDCFAEGATLAVASGKMASICSN